MLLIERPEATAHESTQCISLTTVTCSVQLSRLHLLPRSPLEILESGIPAPPDHVKPSLNDPALLPRHLLALDLPRPDASCDLIRLVCETVVPLCHGEVVRRLLGDRSRETVWAGDDVERLGFVRWVCTVTSCQPVPLGVLGMLPSRSTHIRRRDHLARIAGWPSHRGGPGSSGRREAVPGRAPSTPPANESSDPRQFFRTPSGRC